MFKKEMFKNNEVLELVGETLIAQRHDKNELLAELMKCFNQIKLQQPIDAIAALAEMMHDDDGDRLILSIDENEIENIQPVTEMNEIENIPVVAEMLFDQEYDLLLSDVMDYIEQHGASSFDPIFPTTSENERQDGSMTVVQEAQEWTVDEEGNIHLLEENINSEIPSTSSANEIQDRNDDFNQQVSSSSVSSHDNIPLITLDSDEEVPAGDIRTEIKPIHPFFGPYRRVTPQRPRILSDVMLKTAKIKPLRVADTRTSARTRPYTRPNSNPIVEPNESPDIFGNLSNLGLQMGRGREKGRYLDWVKIIKGWFYNSKNVGGTVVCPVLKREKATASGFPSDNMTESEKDEYIRELETHEGVQLNRDEILFNPGRRYVTKLCCNTLWGKTAQKWTYPTPLGTV
ncbi:hypothetical protein TKK_0001597 [Trichogramma kaykai]